MNRRELLASLLKLTASCVAATSLPYATNVAASIRHYRIRFLRPPGALPENDLLGRCIRCGQCAEICPTVAIKYFTTQAGLAAMGTPFITPREQACILCMKCGDVCPTGAIKPISRTRDNILNEVRMGKAQVDKSLCLSYQGRTCGVCVRACPLGAVAIRAGYLEQPHIQAGCIGCGICERACIQMPQAVRILPNLV